MNQTSQQRETPFQTIANTVKATGLSEHAIRQGVKGGKYPHVNFGTKYLVNVPALLEMLNNQSLESIHSGRPQK